MPEPTTDAPDEDPGLLFRLGQNPVVQVALFALTLASLYVLDRTTRSVGTSLPTLLAQAALIAAALFAAGLLLLGLRRFLLGRRSPPRR